MIRVLIKLSILFPRTSENFLVNRLVLLAKILTDKEYHYRKDSLPPDMTGSKSSVRL